MMKPATVRVTLQGGGQLSFVNARAEEGNGKLIIFKTPEEAAKEATATILASLETRNIASWKIEEANP